MALTRRTPLRRGKPLTTKRSTPRAFKTPRCTGDPRLKKKACHKPALGFAPYCTSHLKVALDILARQRVFDLNGWKCQACGTEKNLQWSHWPSRSYLATRWKDYGSTIHCSACHLRFTYASLEHEVWVIESLGSKEAGAQKAAVIKQEALDGASGKVPIDLETEWLRLGPLTVSNS